MNIAIVSDTHFGNPLCSLVKGKNGKYIIGSKYNDFKNYCGSDLDYLIILGDIIDLSFCTYEDAFSAAQVFFEKLICDNITRKIIYVPGNHDVDCWYYKDNEENQVKSGHHEYNYSVPGIIDLRSENKSTDKFQLAGIKDRKSGSLFLDRIVDGLEFYVVYPNLYIMTDTESILLTHGQYFEPFWCLLSEMIKGIKEDSLCNNPELSKFLSLNFPLDHIACSEMGRTELLNNVILKIHNEVNNSEFNTIEEYLNHLDERIDDMTEYSWISPKKWVAELYTDIAKKNILKTIHRARSSRFDKYFVTRNEVCEKIKTYLITAQTEFDIITKNYPGVCRKPDRIIFGHTHQPVSWNAVLPPEIKSDSGSIRLYNCGGWLYKGIDKDQKFPGAEIFKIDTDKSISSVRIRKNSLQNFLSTF